MRSASHILMTSRKVKSRPISTIFLNEFAARDKGNFHASGKNRTRDPPVQWLERPINTCYLEGREFNSRVGYENFRCPGRA